MSGWVLMAALALQVTEPGTVPAKPPAQAPDTELLSLWPPGVEMPRGMRLYQKTRWTQRLVINNGLDDLRVVHENHDDYFQNALFKQNPNRIFPWRVSGGMDNVHGGEGVWSSQTALAIPDGKDIVVWSQRIHAGASRPLPKVFWRYPIGTVAADLLSYQGKLFELRTMTRTTEGWRGRTTWEDPDHRPLGYNGPGRSCKSCHQHAGGFLEYGMLIRGNDGLFSPPILKEGTLEPDFHGPFPVRYWRKQDG